MKIKEADKFIVKTRTLEWKAKRKKELAKILKSNKTCRKTELLGHPKKLTAKHFEFFFRGMTVKYIKSKEANLVTAFHQISQYMTTIDEQSDTILWLKADLEDRKASHEIYYERIVQWQEIVEAKNEEIRKVWEDRNNAIRSYNGLVQLGKSAEELGIDTKKFVLPEEDEKKYKDYSFSVNGKVLESGRTSYKMTLEKKGKKK